MVQKKLTPISLVWAVTGILVGFTIAGSLHAEGVDDDKSETEGSVARFGVGAYDGHEGVEEAPLQLPSVDQKKHAEEY